ncbi:MAG: 2-oxoacid:acceptor oxidoreductase family protein [Planctomycetota bacterium]|jgi:indolepyruvate ferredoxin oxidoreductase beta subunit|nr:pyruvate ferredoxin oxidoreductase [Candidatus Woesearchaeota archaeon]MDP6384626.1 2-oxoacid:acceptor oxidoreductase family protein [Planctomycetota bacterium]
MKVATTLRILVVGVGGQGVLSASRAIGQAAGAKGIDVRIGQLHGLSQRGGSVESTVCLGPGSTGFVSAGQADVLLALEPMEALRALPRLHSESTILVNTMPITPFSLTLAGGTYPDEEGLVDALRGGSRTVHGFDGSALAAESGSARSLNAFMLGTLAGFDVLPLEPAELRGTFAASGHQAFRSVNLAAFDAGLAQAQILRDGESKS